MARLQEEVRSAFTRYEDINAASTAPLKYIKAVAQEAMRVYPPLPFALPRVVPRGGCTVDGHFVPGGVRSYKSLGLIPHPAEKHLLTGRHDISRLLFLLAHLRRACRRPTLQSRGSLGPNGGSGRIRPMTSTPASRFRMGRGRAWEEGNELLHYKSPSESWSQVLT